MYSIIRAKKHKSLAAVARSARHTFREQPTPNADSTRSNQNRIVGAKSCHELIQAMDERLPAKRRRDAVVCIEYLITASPESFERHGGPLDDLGAGYFRDALAWVRSRHGSDNVLCAAVHLDESTPHMAVYVIPLTSDLRLSARDFLGGPKVMTEMQDSFHAACGMPRGFLRGVKGSKAKHNDIASFYRALADAGEAPRLCRIDYIAKAAGYETEAWQKADGMLRANAKEVAVESIRKKAQLARAKVIEQHEQELRASSSRLQHEIAALDQRARSVSRREMEIVRRQPELEITQAKVEALERLLNQQRSLVKESSRGLSKKAVRDKELTLGITH
ncbi:MobV family relaxase [Stutzerimonas kirkiae]|uniref:MobV family relaxase n=1 Tax=Stutzerimonas kirkiae TaxID=2211392 RepID=UPI0010383449|nr:MobV family relaxase [Stutzerimonas kirkiae]TBV11348.1 hypothetical protein DNK08_03600 [Stutzerimonas kirkiae]